VVTTHSEDHPERGSDEAAHGGSCEALRADGTAVQMPVVLTTPIVLPLPESQVVPHFQVNPAPAPTGSPPLFLLYAALLI
jgi:hypothetical protein